ncbi:hypothetical protein LTR05_003554 [Lithohypha guttulata]|uniref:Uncharacterized protein n=1 Tax=Lithohypha guttulata TaxID=1690604 RepID=A0AAN7YGU7_9EURO|nr:hypothetical protein LTR05_003554 [Lithohypha guttulata]
MPGSASVSSVILVRMYPGLTELTRTRGIPGLEPHSAANERDLRYRLHTSKSTRNIHIQQPLDSIHGEVDRAAAIGYACTGNKAA